MRRSREPVDTEYLDSLDASQIAATPDLTERQLSHLASLDDMPKQEAVASHPNTGPAALEYLARFSHSSKVVETVLSRPGIRRSTYEAVAGRPKFNAILRQAGSVPRTFWRSSGRAACDGDSSYRISAHSARDAGQSPVAR